MRPVSIDILDKKNRIMKKIENFFYKPEKFLKIHGKTNFFENFWDLLKFIYLSIFFIFEN